MTRITLDAKVKILQAVVYTTGLITVIFAWNFQLFLAGLAVGWFFWLSGVNGSLHKYSSHKCFTAKNKVAELFVHFMGTVVSLGSNISWAATHRKHHQYTDREGDPHSIHTGTGGFWRAVKIYFYYFPTYLINPTIVKDLTNDSLHRWFHKNYFSVIFAYVTVLALIDPIYVGYFWAIPVLYVYTGISYITVFAHNQTLHKFIGYRNFDTNDYTFNWSVASLLFPGEGNHNNHHALPGAPQNKFKTQDIDLGLWYLRLVGKISNHDCYQKFVT